MDEYYDTTNGELYNFYQEVLKLLFLCLDTDIAGYTRAENTEEDYIFIIPKIIASEDVLTKVAGSSPSIPLQRVKPSAITDGSTPIEALPILNGCSRKRTNFPLCDQTAHFSNIANSVKYKVNIEVLNAACVYPTHDKQGVPFTVDKLEGMKVSFANFKETALAAGKKVVYAPRNVDTRSRRYGVGQQMKHMRYSLKTSVSIKATKQDISNFQTALKLIEK
jgi:hypothetical protein